MSLVCKTCIEEIRKRLRDFEAGIINETETQIAAFREIEDILNEFEDN